MSSYRERIYKDYSANFQDLKPTFDEIAKRRWGRAYDYYFRNWLPPSKDAAIVDLACGGGALLYFFKERGYTNLTGVDISPPQVALSKQVIPNVVESSVLDFLESNPGQFDLITGLDIAEHFNKDELLRFLDGVRGALKPGGRVILQTINGDTPWASNMRYHDLTHEVGFTPNVLCRLLKMCGFEKPEPRENSPALGYSFIATLRALLWQCIRWKLMFWNYVETGEPGDRVFTRCFLISAVRK
ncbi:MAG TPA: class I SAM-dependent methyltransferase [Planctomycetota bacterium]|nr:class I SAM-dependent methyltransferase [Planctomycetota bacterium]